jgi:transcriptional regulator with XRE-family HTH domain
MKIEPSHLHELATALKAERKRQRLSREEAASVCGVSASFIRDVEVNPENCSLGKLVKLISGLGLSLTVAGMPQVDKVRKDRLKRPEAFGLQFKGNHKNRPGLGLPLANLSKRPDFGVSEDQIVNPIDIRRPLGLGDILSKHNGDKS